MEKQEVAGSVSARSTGKGFLARTSIHAVGGFCVEVAFSALHDRIRGRPVRFRTSPWMLPIYALITPLYEPLHRLVRTRLPAPARAVVYGVGFLTVEYATGAMLRRFHGEAPWDYSYARLHINGLVRPDYFFLWAGAGLALERLHERLTAP